jgi:hypothetical protein
MPDAALFRRRRRDEDFSQVAKLLFQSRQPRRIDPIVIAQKYSHRSPLPKGSITPFVGLNLSPIRI